MTQVKIKRAGTKTAHAVIILDESSSMLSCKQSTISGVNEFINTQKTSKIETNVSIYTFNGSQVKAVVENVPAKQVVELTDYSYHPNGMTNLLDAIGSTIHKINKTLEPLKKEARPSIQLCIITDGEENASKMYTNEAVKSLVGTCETKDWTFMFLGANIDAFSVGSSLGFGVANTIQYDTNQMGNTFNLMASKSEFVKGVRSTGASAAATYAATAFTDEERKTTV